MSEPEQTNDIEIVIYKTQGGGDYVNQVLKELEKVDIAAGQQERRLPTDAATMQFGETYFSKLLDEQSSI